MDQSLVSLHSRVMRSQLQKHFQHNWRIHLGFTMLTTICSNFACWIFIILMDIIWREQGDCFVDIFYFIINLPLHPMGTWVCWFTMSLMQSIELFSWKQILNIVKSLKLMPPTIWDQEQIIKHSSSSDGFITDVWSNSTEVSLSMLSYLRKWALMAPCFWDEAMAKPMSWIIHFDCVESITQGNPRGEGKNCLVTFLLNVNQSGVGIRNCTKPSPGTEPCIKVDNCEH